MMRRMASLVSPLARRVTQLLGNDHGAPPPPTRHGDASDRGIAEYWTAINVTNHHRFADATESLEYLDWRNDQYVDYALHMPVGGLDDLAVLDYGCGPGHDVVGMAVRSRPRRLVGADVSSSS